MAKYEYRKSIGGYRVDKYDNGTWFFERKFRTKRECINYIEEKTKKPMQPNQQLSIF